MFLHIIYKTVKSNMSVPVNENFNVNYITIHVHSDRNTASQQLVFDYIIGNTLSLMESMIDEYSTLHGN